jgi:hypothetical protein
MRYLTGIDREMSIGKRVIFVIHNCITYSYIVFFDSMMSIDIYDDQLVCSLPIQPSYNAYQRLINENKINQHRSVVVHKNTGFPLVIGEYTTLNMNTPHPRQLWFTRVQRDHFCNEAILKLQESIERHKHRAISIYGRAHMINALFFI